MPSQILLYIADKTLQRAVKSAFSDDVQKDVLVNDNFDAVKKLLTSGNVGVLFVDFQLPDMAGLRVLQVVRSTENDIKTIAISDAFNDETRNMVMTLGGFAAIDKPPSEKDLADVVQRLGFSTTTHSASHEPDPLLEIYQEISEECLKTAAKSMKKATDLDLQLISCNVNMFECCAYTMVLNEIRQENNALAISQSFYGAGIAGESFILLQGSFETLKASSFKKIDNLDQKLSLLAQTSNACFLKCFSNEIDTPLMQCAATQLVSDHVDTLITDNQERWQENLVFESIYQIKDTECYIATLLFYPQKSSATLKNKIAHLLEE